MLNYDPENGEFFETARPRAGILPVVPGVNPNPRPGGPVAENLDLDGTRTPLAPNITREMDRLALEAARAASEAARREIARNKAYMHTTGPSHIYIQGWKSSDPDTGGSQSSSSKKKPGDIYYLGTCERAPAIESSEKWIPVYADVSSKLVSFDEEFAGKEVLIVLDLNRYNQEALAVVLDSPGHTRNDGQDRQEFRLDRGSLLVLNSNGFSLWITNSFYKTSNAAPGLTAGNFYPFCKLISSYTDSPGRETRRVRLIIEPKPYYTKDRSFEMSSSFESNFNKLKQPL